MQKILSALSQRIQKQKHEKFILITNLIVFYEKLDTTD